jgi:WD40 repeat protein
VSETPRLTLLCGHADLLTALAFAPDGSVLASGDDQGWVTLWDLAGRTGTRVLRRPDLRRRPPWPDPPLLHRRGPGDPRRRLPRVRPPEGVTHLAFLPGGGRLAVAVWFDGVEIWDVASGTLERRLPLSGPIAVDGDALWAFEPAAGGRGVRLDPVTGRRTRVVSFPGLAPGIDPVLDLGQRRVTQREDDELRAWDLDTGQRVPHAANAPEGGELVARASDGRRVPILRFDEAGALAVVDPGSARSVAVRPDLVAAGEDSGAVRLTTRHGALDLPTTRAEVVAVAFTPDGERLVSAHADGVVRGWSLSTGACTHQVRSPWGRLVALHPDGALALSADRHVAWVWEVATGAVRLRLSASSAREWALAGRTVVTRDHLGVTAWDLATGACVYRDRGPPPKAMALDREGERLATAWGARRPGVRVSTLATGRTTDLPPAPERDDEPVSLAFSPDGRTLVRGGEGFSVRAWDLPTGAHLGEWAPHHDSVRVAVSVDGRIAGALDYDAAIWLHDPASSTSRALFGHRGAARAVAFSPDGRWLASGAVDGAVCLWDPRTGERATTFQVLPSGDGWVTHTPRDAWLGSPDAQAFLRRGAGVVPEPLPPPAPGSVARALAAATSREAPPEVP